MLENEAFAKGISQMLNRSKELELNGRKKKKKQKDLNSFLDRLPAAADAAAAVRSLLITSPTNSNCYGVLYWKYLKSCCCREQLEL